MSRFETGSPYRSVTDRGDEVAAKGRFATNEQTVKSVQSISTAARESAAGVTEVSNVAQDRGRITEELQDNVRVFVLDQDGEKPAPSETTVATPPAGDGHRVAHPA